MDEDSGINKFLTFVKSFPDNKSKYDYFNILEHVSSCKLDKQTVNEIFNSSSSF
jgi:hypothetical protein